MSAVLFWFFAALMAAAALGLASMPLWRRRRATPPPAAYDVTVYRSQLSEIERDMARGALTEDEAEGARREIARRLLAADAELETQAAIEPAPTRISQLTLASLFAPLAIGGVVFYLVVGAPGAPDMPVASRDLAAERKATQLTQATAQARAAAVRAQSETAPAPEPDGQTAALIRRVEQAILERPEDPEGRVLLARAYMRLGRHAEAARLFQEAVDLAGGSAQPGLFAALGEAMMLAAGGYVSQEAEAAFRRAPDLPISGYFIGVAQVQRSEPREALNRWVRIYLEDPSAPFAATLLDEIASLADETGLDGAAVKARLSADAGQGPTETDSSADQVAQAPAEADPPRGPTAEQMAAAADMSADDRAAMIQGMVDGLAARLADDPNDLEGWLRLIRAYGVLGRPEAAADALQTARAAFADDDDALQRLDAAAP